MSINLSIFQRPSRYIGNETNIIQKKSDIKVALCFPDTYEIGMSHIGLKILYSIINNIPYASAERVFSPWLDYESYLRHNALNITSLENKRPLKDFDIVGITLQYELSYTNILTMLDLGGIPIKTTDRGDEYPLIIAGGSCTVNPLALTPFIDAFVVGDGEDVIGEIIDLYKNFKMHSSNYNSHTQGHRTLSRTSASGFKRKEDLLVALSNVEGVYVPLVHTDKRKKITKRIVKNLDTAVFPDSPVIPFSPIIHDRVPIEIARGCTKGCRFCQAGMINRPLRERSLEKVLSLSHKSLLNTGYEEISFTSLSTGDYSNLPRLLRAFNSSCTNYPVAISLPSLRVGSVNSDVLKEIKNTRKTGFTIAPEAGTKRLRDVINKDFTEEEYEETLTKLYREGWQNLKLYFMIGLPTETREDIEGILNMVKIAVEKAKKITGGRVNINTGISAFVPKPHTPFQWLGQAPYDELREKQDLLRHALRKMGVHFKGQHIELSLLEAVFSRGDSTCASLLESAWRLGCHFDGWSESFDFDKWLNAAEKTGIDLYQYAARTYDFSSELPWDFIDTGITKKFLRSEYEKSIKKETTIDCKHLCSRCGLECHEEPEKKINVSREARRTRHNKDFLQYDRFPLSPVHNRHVTQRPLHSIRVRVKFSKTGILRYLSHREVITAFSRVLRRAHVPLFYSKGFHPHPKISFGPPLPVGVEGINEYFDVELPASLNHSDILPQINASLPEGLKVHSATHVHKKGKALNDFISRYEYEINIDKTMNESIHSFISLQKYMVTRERTEVDIRPMVERTDINNGSLNVTLVDTTIFKVRLYELLGVLLQKPVEHLQTVPIRRVFLYGYHEGKGWIDPIEDTIHEQ